MNLLKKQLFHDSSFYSAPPDTYDPEFYRRRNHRILIARESIVPFLTKIIGSIDYVNRLNIWLPLDVFTHGFTPREFEELRKHIHNCRPVKVVVSWGTMMETVTFNHTDIGFYDAAGYDRLVRETRHKIQDLEIMYRNRIKLQNNYPATATISTNSVANTLTLATQDTADSTDITRRQLEEADRRKWKVTVEEEVKLSDSIFKRKPLKL